MSMQNRIGCPRRVIVVLVLAITHALTFFAGTSTGWRLERQGAAVEPTVVIAYSGTYANMQFRQSGSQEAAKAVHEHLETIERFQSVPEIKNLIGWERARAHVMLATISERTSDSATAKQHWRLAGEACASTGRSDCSLPALRAFVER
jgi:hypothetical protein